MDIHVLEIESTYASTSTILGVFRELNHAMHYANKHNGEDIIWTTYLAIKESEGSGKLGLYRIGAYPLT